MLLQLLEHKILFLEKLIDSKLMVKNVKNLSVLSNGSIVYSKNCYNKSTNKLYTFYNKDYINSPYLKKNSYTISKIIIDNFKELNKYRNKFF